MKDYATLGAQTVASSFQPLKVGADPSPVREPLSIWSLVIAGFVTSVAAGIFVATLRIKAPR